MELKKKKKKASEGNITLQNLKIMKMKKTYQYKKWQSLFLPNII